MQAYITMKEKQQQKIQQPIFIDTYSDMLQSIQYVHMYTDMST